MHASFLFCCCGALISYCSDTTEPSSATLTILRLSRLFSPDTNPLHPETEHESERLVLHFEPTAYSGPNNCHCNNFFLYSLTTFWVKIN